MDTKTGIGLLASSAMVCLGVLLAPISSAGERPIKVSYAGIGYATASDPNGDGFPVDLSLTDSQGTLGSAKLAITTEWFISPHACPAGYDVPFALVNTATAYTFADQSQLFGFSQDGWLCANSTTGAYYGEEHGVYGGGTGRFKGATGEWTTKFEGATLDPAIDFRSIRGTAEGRLVMP
jgi:hypothetical protein